LRAADGRGDRRGARTARRRPARSAGGARRLARTVRLGRRRRRGRRERGRARGGRGERAPDRAAPPRRGGDWRRPARAALPPQARPDRVLRPALVKVLRLQRAGDLRLHEEPEPRAADGEVLVHVTAVGLCGSDRHWFVEAGIGDAVLDRPLVLGHEFAGVIASGPRAGERVVLDPAVPCRRCDVCLAGLPHLCPSGRFAGHGSTDGALRTSLAWPEDLAHWLPDRIPDTEAALLEPLGVALHALDLGHVRRGTRTGVFGCGPIGLLLVQAIGAAGGETVVATDPLPHRRTAALTAGAAEA